MTLRINFHGGKCCGIKTISHLCGSPEYTLWPTASTSSHVSRIDAQGGTVSSDTNFYPFARPKETAGERFDAYMDFLREHRPNGLVEVTLVRRCGEVVQEEYPSWGTYEYQEKWVPFLEERGFERVARFANSNSGNYVEVYHYVMREAFDYKDRFVIGNDDEDEDYDPDEDDYYLSVADEYEYELEDIDD